ncbi:uncharacterized protein BCR38DRAFT_370176 [Pseudomassariella vexata]|uniref:DUF7702 domain-containing protein n=1 Tax=Pseudomassariella vexata TaxID=1141098 RepID=A0A1Y2DZ28_9PEZI|nr:uncharacterized protein BCR38DRAFT_370176 [Pseudomassariella vexata]ORY64487.1 hypothetical protein BCR38DRAFT_370176 [Pseudomassariella vexata]
MDGTGVFTYRDGVAVIQLVSFAVFLAFAFVLCSRHGFGRSSGWFILIPFSIIRLLAASFQLATIHFPSRSIYGGALICQNIGLSPLTVLNLGLLLRGNRFVNAVDPKLFTGISLTGFTAIALAIHGGTQAAEAYGSTATTLQSNAETKAATMLFLATYLASVIMFLLMLRKWQAIPKPEHKLLICFAVCAPFIIVRLLYSIIGNFTGNLQFSALFGNVTIFLVMAVLEEIVVVGFTIVTGMRLRILPKNNADNNDEEGADSVKLQKQKRRGRGESV